MRATHTSVTRRTILLTIGVSVLLTTTYYQTYSIDVCEAERICYFEI